MTNTPELLPADRQRLLKEHLMSEIALGEKAPRPRRRLVWLVASPLAVGALAAVTLAVPSGRDGGAAPAAPTTAPPTTSATSAPATPAPAATDAAALLSRAAKAAAGRPTPDAGNHRFTYQRMIEDGDLESRHERSMWFPVDGRSAGMIADPTMSGADANGRISWPATIGAGHGAPQHADFSSPTYEFVAGLPTDPDRLLQQLISADRSKSVVGMPVTPKLSSQLAFGDVQKIFMNVTAPPAVAGALMTAAAKLPGTAVVADEADAAGRHGVAVVGTNGTQRVSLVFDPATGAFLGVREVLLTDLPAGGPGDLPPTGNPGPGAGNGKGYTFVTAVLESGVVDRAGDRPKG
ncbi:CU044_5270 family protein [Kitasatospora sp. NPDC004745]|uniref:CU044_5270 family protein n=1 Tax=Kitasatospora sp. NPDC004745 TaxID=3364019 RepID=UPI0036D0467D